jgi:phosphatidylglycerophosphatase A
MKIDAGRICGNGERPQSRKHEERNDPGSFIVDEIVIAVGLNICGFLAVCLTLSP